MQELGPLRNVADDLQSNHLVAEVKPGGERRRV